MLRRIAAAGLVVALAACGSEPAGPGKTGPAVARGTGVLITADEFKARLEEQSPFIRARYSTLERKKEFLDNLVRFEVLANEARRQGLDKDPEVISTVEKILVQKLVQRKFQDQSGAKDIPDADLQKYYDEHHDEFFRPRRMRLAGIVWTAPKGSPERAKKAAAAARVVKEVKAEEKKNAMAFAAAVTKHSEDAASRAVAGDLGFKTRAEMETAWGPAVAEAASALKMGETSGLLETDAGLMMLKATGVQEELNRPFEAVKQQIAGKLFREKRTKDFDALVKRLKDEAKVTVDEKALEAVTVAGAAGPTVVPGAVPGMGASPHGAPPPGAPPAAPPTTPAK
jgi:peptidyl-prolyl cis-trans isomerase C